MAPNLGFVTHTAQGHAHVLAAGGLGDRLTERGFTDARRADQTQDRRFEFVDSLLHREVFHDAVFDFFQTKVVLVQHDFGIAQIVFDFGALAPRQTSQHIDVIAHHAGFGRHGRHQLEFFQLGVGFFARLNRHFGGFDLLLDLFDVSTVFALTQFFLDGFDLFVQIKITLIFFHLPFHAATDFFVHVQDVDFALQLGEQVFQPVADAGQIQHQLFVFQLERQMRGNRIGQASRLIDAGN